jgi:argininosuccinate synthase
VVLAYSGGLDTSVILKWLQDEYGCEVVTFTADIGQGEEVEPARAKAEAAGIKEIYIEDLREEFVRDFVYPMFRANAIYEGEYLLGTSIARPLIAKRLVEIANETGADADLPRRHRQGQRPGALRTRRLRAEARHQGHRALARMGPALAREADGLRREHGIPVDFAQQGKKSPYSMDANLLHISYEGYDPRRPLGRARKRTCGAGASPRGGAGPADLDRADLPRRRHRRHRRQGDDPARSGELNKVGGANGIGRADIVENRYVGMKSRGCYETPGGTIMLKAHRAMESLTLDREAAHLKDELMPRYAELIYNGYWFSPEREMLQALDRPDPAGRQRHVRLKLYKGNVIVVGRKSDSDSLFDESIATFEDDAGAYDQGDARASSSSMPCACDRVADPLSAAGADGGLGQRRRVLDPWRTRW